MAQKGYLLYYLIKTLLLVSKNVSFEEIVLSYLLMMNIIRQWKLRSQLLKLIN